MNSRFFKLSALMCALALAGCGGGGDAGFGVGAPAQTMSTSIQAPVASVITAGASAQLSGNSSTNTTVIKSLIWSVTPAAIVGNADCASGVKNSEIYASNTQGATGNSQWSCSATLMTDAAATASVNYIITLTTTDDKGNLKSAQQKIYMVPAPVAGANGFAVNPGANFAAASGSVNNLRCAATGGIAPYAYTWTVSDSAGYNVAFSSFAGGDATFTAPKVSASTPLSFTCSATDAVGSVASATVAGTIAP